MDCKPDEQKRLMVCAGMLSQPGAEDLPRDVQPCEPSGMAQPNSTSSMSCGASAPSTRRSSRG